MPQVPETAPSESGIPKIRLTIRLVSFFLRFSFKLVVNMILSPLVTINEGETADAGVTSVCISPNGRLVAASSLDTIVRIWDVQTGQLVERLKGHRDSVYSVVFTPDGSGLVSGSLDKTLKYWDLRPLLR